MNFYINYSKSLEHLHIRPDIQNHKFLELVLLLNKEH